MSAVNSKWDIKPADAAERNLVEVTENALQYAAKLGASDAETGLSTTRGLSVTVRNRAVETIEHNRDKSIAITVYFGKRSGSASTTDFSAAAIKTTVDKACNIAKFTEPDEYCGLADRELLATEFPDLDIYHPHALEVAAAIEIATECESTALDHTSQISNSEGATLSSHSGVDLYANSTGFRGISRGSQHGLGCAVIAGKGDAMQRDYWQDSVRKFTDLPPAQSIGEKAANRTVRRLNAKKAATGEYPVIFESSVAGSLLGHLVAAISGASLYRKSSFLLEALDKPIFPKFVRICERPHLPKSAGAANFDGEGVATKTRDIVADGILRGYVLNSYAARKLNMQTTANAGGVHNLELTPSTELDLDGLINQIGRGLLVTELIGFGVNTVTGDYSRGAFGFWFEHGEIQYAVQEFTIAGNLTQIFTGITAAAADMDTRGNIRCGSIAIDNMTVAGT